jgi:uncharacterized protein Yka (UPF0111/DUF47 family)
VFLDRLVRLLQPQDNRFITYLEAIAHNVAVGADCFAGYRDAQGHDDFVKIAENLRRIEHEGDAMAHLLYDELDKTFVTPIDREDLHDLCSELDDVLDIMEACSGRIVIYRLEHLTEPMREMVRVIQAAAHEVESAVKKLGDDSKHLELPMQFVRVHALENEGDVIYRTALGELFTKPVDAVELIRQKEILDALERAIDACDDVCDLLRSVVMKHG